MKAIIPKQESQHERDLIDNANHVAQSMMALFVYYLYTCCNNNPETCRKRFEGMTSLVYMHRLYLAGIYMIVIT